MAGREGKTKTGEQNQTDFLHGVEKPDDMHVRLSCNAGLHRTSESKAAAVPPYLGLPLQSRI